MSDKKKLSGGKLKVIMRGKLVQLFGGVCSINGCTETENLEFGHVRNTNVSGKSRGSHLRYKDVRDHPVCYKLFCPVHHQEYDEQKAIEEYNRERKKISSTETNH